MFLVTKVPYCLLTPFSSTVRDVSCYTYTPGYLFGSWATMRDGCVAAGGSLPIVHTTDEWMYYKTKTSELGYVFYI